MFTKTLRYVEIAPEGNAQNAGYAPYLNYRPLLQEEKSIVASILEAGWLRKDLESQATSYAIAYVVPIHLQEVRQRKEELLAKTMRAVKERLTNTILCQHQRGNITLVTMAA